MWTSCEHLSPVYSYVYRWANWDDWHFKCWEQNISTTFIENDWISFMSYRQYFSHFLLKKWIRKQSTYDTEVNWFCYKKHWPNMFSTIDRSFFLLTRGNKTDLCRQSIFSSSVFIKKLIQSGLGCMFKESSFIMNHRLKNEV